MSTRPIPRKSSLAGATPVAPDLTPKVPVSEYSKSEVSQGKKERKRYPHKVSFYQEAEETARMRGALLHTQSSEGPRSLSQFIRESVMKEVKRLEKKYNDGQPFPLQGAKELPQGRPLTMNR